MQASEQWGQAFYETVFAFAYKHKRHKCRGEFWLRIYTPLQIYWSFHTKDHWNYFVKLLCKMIQIVFDPILRSFVSDPFQKSTMNIYSCPTIEGTVQKYDQTIITHIRNLWKMIIHTQIYSHTLLGQKTWLLNPILTNT